jgi:PAS domain S-box-containing protein
MIIAATAFAGWWAGLPLLSTWGLGLTVRPLAAMCVFILGLALAQPGGDGRFASAAGSAIAALSVLYLAAILLMGDLDTWVPGASPTAVQVPKVAALALALTGGALALSRRERRHVAATLLAGLAAAIAVFALLGHLTGLEALYGPGQVILPPLPTAVALICVLSGIALRIGRMPVPRTARPLWQLLLALGCATVAPLLLFGVYAGVRMAEAQLDQARRDLLIQAHAISANIDRQLASETQKLRALAASPSLREDDFAAFQRQAEAALPGPRRGLILLVDPATMEQLVNTWVPYGTPLPKAVIPGAVERALASGKPQYTGLFAGPVAGQIVFGIVIPVVIDGQKRYALGVSPDRKAFGRLVAALDLPAGWQVTVTDADHRLLARSAQEDGEIGAVLPRVQWSPGRSGGIFEFTGADGRPSIQATAYSDLSGWETEVWAPEELLAPPVRALWRALGWLALVAFVLVAALALWLGRLIAGAVGHAASAAAALGEGAPLPSGTTPVAEVNTLIGQLHEAAAGREAVEHLLRVSEKTFRVMFDMSSVPKIEVIPRDGRFLRANAAMCKFVGYSEAELLDMTVWDITHPEEREEEREPVRRLISGELPVFDVEKRYIRKDGRAVWAHTTANVIRDEQGRPECNIAVIQDIDAHKRAEEDLRASMDRLELALDAARLGSWQLDTVRNVFTGDARAKGIFGVDLAREYVPMDELLRLLYPEDVHRVLRAIAEALNPADPKRAVNQFRVKRRGGEIRWIETLGQAYFEGEGPRRRSVSIVGTCQDITERKEREEKEHLLMREVNHRAKNMLSVVHAIAHQTATRNPADFIDRFSERIQALSANQDLLVRNEWNGVGVEDLVRAQLAHFVGLIGTRIAVAGPALRLRASSAQAIGLALHELATNAGKYGALSTDKGRVDVSWGIDGHTFTMNWTESEGPPVSKPTRRGFGSVVMDQMAARSVAGEVRLDYAEQGVRWRLTCPAVNALESREEPFGTESDLGAERGGRAERNRIASEPAGVSGAGAVLESEVTADEPLNVPRRPAEEGPDGGVPRRPQFKTELRGR